MIMIFIIFMIFIISIVFMILIIFRISTKTDRSLLVWKIAYKFVCIICNNIRIWLWNAVMEYDYGIRSIGRACKKFFCFFAMSMIE